MAGAPDPGPPSRLRDGVAWRAPRPRVPSPPAGPPDVLEYCASMVRRFSPTSIREPVGVSAGTVDALWDLVWAGRIANDTLHPLRAYIRTEDKRAARRPRMQPFRSRRLVPRTAEGRWSTVETRKTSRSAATEWSAAIAQQLLTRHGVVTRETVAAESIPGGFSAVYESDGRSRANPARVLVGGLGGAQFALPAAVDLLRSFRTSLSRATWCSRQRIRPIRTGGREMAPRLCSGQGHISRGPDAVRRARVILVDGFAAAHLRRGERELILFAPEAEPRRSRTIRQVALALLELAAGREQGRRAC